MSSDSTIGQAAEAGGFRERVAEASSSRVLTWYSARMTQAGHRSTWRLMKAIGN